MKDAGERDRYDLSSIVAVAVPVNFALPAVECILSGFAQTHHDAHESVSLALNLRQLHLPFEAEIRVPVEARVSPGSAHNEWRLDIRAAHNAALYPTFEGLLTLLPVGRCSAQLQLQGRYTVPFGALGKALDVTLMRGAAPSSLQRFVREVACRVAALARWVPTE